MHGQQNI